MGRLVLASRSPRRHDLLKLLGHPFTIMVPDTDETTLDGESPEDHVTRLAGMKARETGSLLDEGIVIGCDTVVVLDGDILGKPSSEDEAVAMLMRIQGRTHVVYTGFALVDAGDGRAMSSHETTSVTMRDMTEVLARDYVATGEPMDKAGSYGIQGYGATLVTRVEGCYFNVMGLPLARLMDALGTFTGGHLGFFGITEHTR